MPSTRNVFKRVLPYIALLTVMVLIGVSMYSLVRLSSIFLGIPNKIKRHPKKETNYPRLNVYQKFHQFRQILIAWDDFTKKSNITYWLDAGTLLGCYRDKHWIFHDNDLDVAIPINDYDKLKSHSSSLLSTYAIDVWRKHGHIVAVFYDTISRIKIDVLAYSECDQMFICSSKAQSWYKQFHHLESELLVIGGTKEDGYGESYLKFNKSIIYPLSQCVMDGVITYCPNDTKKLLIQMYVDIRDPCLIEKYSICVLICCIVIILIYWYGYDKLFGKYVMWRNVILKLMGGIITHQLKE